MDGYGVLPVRLTAFLIGLVLLASRALAAPAFVQTTNTNTGGTSGAAATAAFGSNVTAGNTIFVTATDKATTDTITLAYSSGTATITPVVMIGNPSTSSGQTSVKGFFVVLTTGSLTVQATPGTSVSVSAIAQEFSGVGGLDQHLSGTKTVSGGLITSDSVTTTGPGDLIIAWCGAASSGSPTSGTGFTNGGTANQSTNVRTAIESLVRSGPGAQTATFSVISGTWQMGIVAFLPAGAGFPVPLGKAQAGAGV
ncbi:MAG: hypothetical protein KGL39_37495 [Patescibacteria group bacterium]|nr:hypothetical protein [Patescibacteria group bacterium]